MLLLSLLLQCWGLNPRPPTCQASLLTLGACFTWQQRQCKCPPACLAGLLSRGTYVCHPWATPFLQMIPTLELNRAYFPWHLLCASMPERNAERDAGQHCLLGYPSLGSPDEAGSFFEKIPSLNLMDRASTRQRGGWSGFARIEIVKQKVNPQRSPRLPFSAIEILSWFCPQPMSPPSRPSLKGSVSSHEPRSTNMEVLLLPLLHKSH